MAVNTGDLISIEEDPSAATAGSLGISIEGESKAVLPETVVKERSEKANFGLKDASPGLDSLRNSIGRGDEDYARQAAATAVDLKNRQLKLNIIEQMSANRGNEPVTQDEMDLVKGLSQDQLENPNTIFESQYAKEYINKLALSKKSDDAVFNTQLARNGDDTMDVMDVGQSILTRQEVARTKLQDIKSRWDQTSTLGQIGDFAETFIPFKSWANISNEVPGFKGAGFDLPGNNLREQVQYLWSLPPNEFEAKLTQTLNTIAETNLTDAQQFANAVLSFSTSDEVLNNVFGIADLFDLGSLAVAGVRAARGVARGAASRVPEQQVRKAVADALKASEEVSARAEKVAEVAGEVEQAATIKAIQKVTSEATEALTMDASQKFRGILNTVPSIANPLRPFTDLGNLTREAATRLGEKLATSAARLTDGILEPVQAMRLTPEALAKAVDNANAELRTEFNRLNDSVIDVVQNPRDTVTNTDSVSLRLGDTQAMPFDSLERAEVMARDLYRLPEGAWRVKQEGTNFFIDIPRGIDETDAGVRSLLINTENRTPESNSFATVFLNAIRSPAETASRMAKANRNIVGLAQENSLKFVKEVSAEIGAIPKKNREDFERILRLNRDTTNPDGVSRGRFYETVGDLERAYIQHNGRLPTDQESAAYFSYVQLSDYDWILRNTIRLREKERLGLKKFSFEHQANGYGEYEGPKVTNPTFEGKEVDNIPWNSDHLSLMVYDPTTLATQIIARKPSDETRQAINRLLTEGGYKAVQVADPLARQFKEITGSGEPIQYILTKAFTKTELDPKQIGYQPGGHVLYQNEFWVKQPKLYTAQGGAKYYEGDTTAFNFSSKAQADKFTERMDTARQLMNAGDEVRLGEYLKTHLPYSKSQFKELFAEDGPFDPRNSFYTTQSGQKTWDLNKWRDEGVRDLSNGSYNLTDEIDSTFTGQRDWTGLTIRERGTPENPVFNLHEAELVDPLTTLARGIGQATRSRYFGDMKTHAAESFIEEFADVLKPSRDELRRSPTYWLSRPEWNEKADPVRLAMAKYTQRNAMNFIGEQTPLGQNLEWVKQKMVNTVYRASGDQGSDWVSSSSLMKSRDPVSYLRGIAFHAKLGLFNVNQWFVQAQGIAHMSAILPQHAAQSVAAYALQRRLIMNDAPEIVEGMARASTKLGWRAEDFKESWAAMNRSGWANVGREQALLDDMSDPSLFQGTAGKFLNKSAVFFLEAERMVRGATWNAAYREWKKANPFKAIDDREIGQIMTRADTLSVNMTRASKTMLEQGVLSIPTQFSSYQARMMDQFFGKQLTAGEKARVFGMYSTLYGVPVGVGAATGYPFYEDIRQYALENGITVSDKFVNLLIEGLPSMITTAITGEEYNVAQRFGPGGFQFIRDLVNGDKTVAEIAVGASGQMVGDIVSSTNPILTGIGAVFKEGGGYEPLVADIVDASRNISSVNNTLRMAMALNTGKYLTKNDVYLTNMGSMDSIFSGIVGVTPREVSDAFLMQKSLRQTKDLEKEAEKQFQKYYRRGLHEGANGNQQAMEAYFKRARAYLILGDIQPNKYSEILSRAVQNQGSVIERMATKWFRDAPASQVQKRLEQTIKNTEQRQ